jgi:hypothetical protein
VAVDEHYVAFVKEWSVPSIEDLIKMFINEEGLLSFIKLILFSNKALIFVSI